jgi:AcrR family transcriptional regulator
MPAPNPERRGQILRAAATLFARKGIASTTVRDIGEAAGVLSGLLYHYFPSKDAVVTTILREFVHDAYRRNLEVVHNVEDPSTGLRGLIRVASEMMAEQPEVTSIYQTEQKYLREHDLLRELQQVVEANRRIWTDTIASAVASGKLRSDIDAGVFYELLRDALWSSIRWNDPPRVEPADLATIVTTIFLEGAGTPASIER